MCIRDSTSICPKRNCSGSYQTAKGGDWKHWNLTLPRISFIACRRWFFLRKQWSTHGTCNTPPDYNLTAARMNEASFCRKQSNMKSMPARWLTFIWSWFLTFINERLRTISDQYMIGSDLMVTPLYENKKSRKVYFPEGVWYNLNTNEKYRVMVTS